MRNGGPSQPSARPALARARAARRRSARSASGRRSARSARARARPPARSLSARARGPPAHARRARRARVRARAAHPLERAPRAHVCARPSPKVIKSGRPLLPPRPSTPPRPIWCIPLRRTQQRGPLPDGAVHARAGPPPPGPRRLALAPPLLRRLGASRGAGRRLRAVAARRAPLGRLRAVAVCVRVLAGRLGAAPGCDACARGRSRGVVAGPQGIGVRRDGWAPGASV